MGLFARAGRRYAEAKAVTDSLSPQRKAQLAKIDEPIEYSPGQTERYSYGPGFDPKTAAIGAGAGALKAGPWGAVAGALAPTVMSIIATGGKQTTGFSYQAPDYSPKGLYLHYKIALSKPASTKFGSFRLKPEAVEQERERMQEYVNRYEMYLDQQSSGLAEEMLAENDREIGGTVKDLIGNVLNLGWTGLRSVQGQLPPWASTFVQAWDSFKAQYQVRARKQAQASVRGRRQVATRRQAQANVRARFARSI
jgi:hypothetical protein